MTASTHDDETLREARRMHRPAMDRGQITGWILGWSVGLGALWYTALGFGLCTMGDDGTVGAITIAVTAAVQLLLPGVGVRNPGGARGPVILRSALTMSALWSLGWAAVMAPLQHESTEGLAAGLWATGVIALLGAPLVGVLLAYFAFVGRGPIRSALLNGGAAALALFALAGPGLSALIDREGVRWTRLHPQGPAWFVASVLFGLAALAALARNAARRDALDPARWVEGQLSDNTLRIGDDVRAAPESFKGYAGPVCAYLPRVPPSAPGRGAAPIPADALLPCARAQLPMLLADARDAASSLALYLATAGALAAAAKLARTL